MAFYSILIFLFSKSITKFIFETCGGTFEGVSPCNAFRLLFQIDFNRSIIFQNYLHIRMFAELKIEASIEDQKPITKPLASIAIKLLT